MIDGEMDTELYAMKQLSRRVTGWRVTIAFCFLSIAAHLGWIFYLALDAHFMPLATGVTKNIVQVFCILLGFIPPMLLFGAAGFRVGRTMVERRLGSWIDQLSAQLGVDRHALESAAAQYRPSTPDDELD